MNKVFLTVLSLCFLANSVFAEIMHDEFIEPTKQFADIIIPNSGNNDKAISMMQLYISSALHGF